ncbi:Trk family potassium uptake protein, partial [Enterococcus durans]|nr:Trk family potassium uptake protein [Enterococcus durans]
MKKKRNKKISPVQLIAAGFFVLILIGGGLLSLPMFSQNGQQTNFLDALFTATSAICVTGLTTLNTA